MEVYSFPRRENEVGFINDLAGASGDDAKVGGGSDGVVRGGTDLGSREEGGNMLEVEHLATELVGLDIDKGELVDEILGEDHLSDGHPDASDANNIDLSVPLH